MAAVVRLFRYARKSDAGAELLEFAIALPILLLVVGGVVEFSLLFQRYQVVTNAAREGARVAVLPDFNTAGIQNRVTAYLRASGLNGTFPAPNVSYRSVAVAPGGPTISTVKVTVRYPYDYVILGPIVGLVGGRAYAQTMLAAASEMRLEVAATP